MHRVIVLILLIAFAAGIFLATSSAKEEEWDIIIVGGGITGLTSAYYLNDYKVLLLEKDNRLGGRIMTVEYEGIGIDMGALLIYNTEVLPFDLTSEGERIYIGPPMGIYNDATLAYGATHEECFSKLGLDRKDLSEILRFKKGQLGIDELSPENYKLLNACFKAWSSGELKDYSSNFQKGAFVNFISHFYYPHGISFIISEYLNRIDADIRLNAEVCSVEDNGNRVEVSYRDAAGETKKAHAKAVIVATPGTVADNIVKDKNEACRRYLASLSYGIYTVAALVIRAGRIDDFSFIKADDIPFNFIARHSDKSKGVDIIGVYFGDKESRKLPQKDKAVVSIVRNGLNKIGIGRIGEKDILFSTVQRWKHGATIITPELLDNWSSSASRPSGRVFLAGDYLDVYFPFAIASAIDSAAKSAEAADKFLKDLKANGK